MNDCIFCKIVSGEIPGVKIRENEEFIAILDAFPNRKGMTLVIPKKHYDSDVFKMPSDLLQRYVLAVKEVVEILKKGLKVDRVGVIIEGLEVNHAHVKLYPMYNNEPFVISGIQNGPRKSIEELQQVKKEILGE